MCEYTHTSICFPADKHTQMHMRTQSNNHETAVGPHLPAKFYTIWKPPKPQITPSLSSKSQVLGFYIHTQTRKQI